MKSALLALLICGGLTGATFAAETDPAGCVCDFNGAFDGSASNADVPTCQLRAKPAEAKVEKGQGEDFVDILFWYAGEGESCGFMQVSRVGSRFRCGTTAGATRDAAGQCSARFISETDPIPEQNAGDCRALLDEISEVALALPFCD